MGGDAAAATNGSGAAPFQDVIHGGTTPARRLELQRLEVANLGAALEHERHAHQALREEYSRQTGYLANAGRERDEARAELRELKTEAERLAPTQPLAAASRIIAAEKERDDAIAATGEAKAGWLNCTMLLGKSEREVKALQEEIAALNALGRSDGALTDEQLHADERVRALRAELNAATMAKNERDQMGAAIEAALDLADSLSDMAIMGAGYADNWGTRVRQAVEPLRDVKAFRDRTLHHNGMLLESNGQLIKAADHARRQAAEWKRQAKAFQRQARALESRPPVDNVPELHRRIQELAEEGGNLSRELEQRKREHDVAIIAMRGEVERAQDDRQRALMPCHYSEDLGRNAFCAASPFTRSTLAIGEVTCRECSAAYERRRIAGLLVGRFYGSGYGTRAVRKKLAGWIGLLRTGA